MISARHRLSLSDRELLGIDHDPRDLGFDRRTSDVILAENAAAKAEAEARTVVAKLAASRIEAEARTHLQSLVVAVPKVDFAAVEAKYQAKVDALNAEAQAANAAALRESASGESVRKAAAAANRAGGLTPTDRNLLRDAIVGNPTWAASILDSPEAKGREAAARKIVLAWNEKTMPTARAVGFLRGLPVEEPAAAQTNAAKPEKPGTLRRRVELARAGLNSRASDPVASEKVRSIDYALAAHDMTGAPLASLLADMGLDDL